MASQLSTFHGLEKARATYRLQFHEGFRLADAQAIVPYLSELGISHIYASPLTKACAHSLHGYDVCDYRQLNPELGTEAELEKLVLALQEHQMGLVLDIVPNHMAAVVENPWWKDMLTHGRQSAFAAFFDIDWECSDPLTRGKVFLPVLGGYCSELLADKQIQLCAGPDGPCLCYAGHQFPVAPGSLPLNGDVGKINGDAMALETLIEQQNYRLAFWKDGDAGLNYRRFFSISSLAGLRVEEQKVFDESHELIEKWTDRGWVQGLRVDHPDGLRDPATYLHRLRGIAPEAWVVIEKILAPDESLPEGWPVAGTTGYDFLAQVNSIFVQTENERFFTNFYFEFTGERTDYGNLVHDKKRAALDHLFPAEINRLLGILIQIAAQNGSWRKFTSAELHEALSELVACFPTYRVYVRGRQGPSRSSEYLRIESAIKSAMSHKADLPREIFDMLQQILLGRMRGDLEDEFSARFQQLTGPAMAKGVEDTAFYCFNRFISLNEVGCNPGQFGASMESFHSFCMVQQKNWPDTMLASTTHDTKRGEDVRARLNILSEIPNEWCSAVRHWAAINQCYHQGSFPDRNAEYLFYQTLVGAWPISEKRLLAYMEKAAREAKQHTDWNEPKVVYEQALQNFVVAAMKDSNFMASVEKFVSSISRPGFINSLSQTLIKLTAPGVPDIYQGCELWNFSLVDPDNRQPVDFEMRRHLLAQAKSMSADEVWTGDNKPLAKLWLIWKTLCLRTKHSELFAGSKSYEPVSVLGQKRAHVIAFKRGEAAITIVQRLPATLQNDWADTSFALPRGKWCNQLTGDIFDGQFVYLKELLAQFPVALLVRKEFGI